MANDGPENYVNREPFLINETLSSGPQMTQPQMQPVKELHRHFEIDPQADDGSKMQEHQTGSGLEQTGQSSQPPEKIGSLSTEEIGIDAKPEPEQNTKGKNVLQDEKPSLSPSDKQEGDDVEVLSGLNSNQKKPKTTWYYPSITDPDCLIIIQQDIGTLEPEKCLNGDIMRLYLRILEERYPVPDKTKPEFYFGSPFIYSKLRQILPEKVYKDSGYKRLRRWWRKLNMLEIKYAFFPINDNKHWSLVILINNSDNQVHYILHLDSAAPFHPSAPIFGNMRRFIELEDKCLKEDARQKRSMVKDVLPRVVTRIVKVPQQPNSWDCGVYVLYFIKRFVEDRPEEMEYKYSAQFGEWFTTEEATGFRSQLKNHLVSLLGE